MRRVIVFIWVSVSGGSFLGKRFIVRVIFLCMKLMVKIIRFIVRICVCWLSFFWIIRYCILMWSCLFFIF